MVRTLYYSVAIVSVIVLAFSTPARPQDQEPDHLRGQIVSVKAASAVTGVVVKTLDGKKVELGLPDNVTVLGLSKDSFTSVDFGVYVGAVAVQLDQYSPIVRDSLSWLHEGYELRFVDEELRGIALGEKKWDLLPGSIMAHGWIDDIEYRVISIKWGPTEIEETDVEIGREKPVFRMSLGDKSLLKEGVHIFAGAQKNGDNKYEAAFVIVGKDGLVPGL